MIDQYLKENTEVDEFLVNMHNEYDYKSARYEEALEYRNSKSVKKYNGNPYKISCSIQKFKKYGPGIYLYFMLLRSLIKIFVVFAIISLPSLVDNYKGHGLQIFGEGSLNIKIMKYSLANQHYYEWNEILKNQAMQKNIDINKKIIVFSDILISITVLLFIIYWKVESVRLVNQCISETALPSYYTIFVKEVPDNYNEEAIRLHFSKFGKVSQISSIKNLSNIQSSITQFCNIIDELKIQRKLIEINSNRNKIKYMNLYNKLIQKYNDLKEEYRTIEKDKTVSAFISFNNIKTRNYIMDLYRFNVSNDHLLYEGNRLKIQKCHIEPTNIIWQNLHIKESTQIKKSILQFMVLSIVLFISLLALFLIQLNKSSQFEIEQNVQYNFAEVIELNNQKVTDSFCYGLSYRSFNEEYYPICKSYLARYKEHLMLTVSYSCVIVLINFILIMIIRALVEFRKYSTNTEKNRFLINNMFLFYFLNTAILTLLVQLEVNQFSIKKIISSVFGISEKHLNVSLYQQFTRKWYINVGSQIVINYLISLVVCPCFLFFVEKLLRYAREFIAAKKQIQKEMNQAILDPEIDFNWYYSQILNVFFFTFFYSSGMPIFYLFGVVSFSLIYLSSKYVFIHYSKEPTMFDHSLNSAITKMLPYSLILHQIMCIFFYNVEEIFPNCSEKDLRLSESLIRKFREGFPFIILLVLTIVYILLQNRIMKWTQEFIKMKQSAGDNELSGGINEKPFDQLYFNKKFIYSYKIEDNPKYENILYTLMVLDTLEKKRKEEIEKVKSESQINENAVVSLENKWKSCKDVENKEFGNAVREKELLIAGEGGNDTERNLTTFVDVANLTH